MANYKGLVNDGSEVDRLFTKINNLSVKDNLISTDTDQPLSANQGKLLNESKVNISDVQDNLTSIDSNKPLSANQGRVLNEKIGSIIGSDSNANGSFIKFSDGTMICKTYVASQTTDSTGRVTWTFPAAFLSGEIPIVTVTPVASLSATQNAISGTTPTSTGVVFLHTMSGAAINTQAVRYCATAIGRWK